MIAARLLAVAGGGGGFTVAPTSDPVQVIAEPDAGGWTEANSPHAAFGNDQTYIAWVTGNANPNDIEIVAVNVDLTYDGPILLKDNLGGGTTTTPDSHLGPSVLIRDDGHLVVAYSGHNAGLMTVKISTSAWDITAGFGSPITVESSARTMTYPVLAQLGTRIFLFARDREGVGSRIVRWYSDDGGSTWSSSLNLYEVTADFVYMAIAEFDDKIHFAVTDKEPDAGDYGLWHFYLEEDGSVFRSDGTEITGFSYPLAPSDLTEIVATGNDSYPYSIGPTSDNRPVIAWQTKAADPVEFGEWRWSGSAWVKTVIDTSDPISPSILSTGGGHHVWGDAGRFIQSIYSAGLRVREYRTTDDGATWDAGRDLGDGSSPVVVKAGSPLVSLWFSPASSFTGSSDFDPGLAGIG